MDASVVVSLCYCVGDTITILVNGVKTVDAWRDPHHRYKVGHLALQCHDPDTVVTFKTVKVKELASR
jgi:hypothetical protein